MAAWLTVVGLGDDGLSGLGDAARQAVTQAAVVIGGARHLALLPDQPGQRRLPWPSPFAGAYPLLAGLYPQPVCVLASGDPMFYGIGATLCAGLAPLLPPDAVTPQAVRVLSAPSCVSLAAARLGWAVQEVVVIPAHGRPLARLAAHLHPGVRLLLLAEGAETPAAVGRLLGLRGFSASRITVFGHLGGPRETRWDGTAETLADVSFPDLAVIAVEPQADPGTVPLAVTPGLPDDAYRHDGQLTKRDIRAVTLARLAPRPGELLWDVGAGSGSIGIEWMRSHPSCRAIAVESHPDRQANIRHNRDALGVPDLHLVEGRAPQALTGLPEPDAVFVGGGITRDGVAEACYAALKPGGRMVATAVTVQSEARLVALQACWGGDLLRLSVAQTRPVGTFLGWDTAMPVTLWTTVKLA